MPVAAEWIPVLAARPSGRRVLRRLPLREERDIASTVARRPSGAACSRCAGPTRSRSTATLAMHAATYAKQIGRAVPFALAAFRQAFAGGRALATRQRR